MDKLAQRRAFKADDCRLWTPADALEFALQEVHEGRIKADAVIITFRKPKRDGEGVDLENIYAGLDTTNIIALLTAKLHMLVAEWLS